MEKNKKAPKAPSEHADKNKKDKLENKDQKNTDLKPAGLNEIGAHEYDEDRTTEIRMKPQPFEEKKQPAPDRASDGL